MKDYLSVGNEKKIINIPLEKISKKNINPRQHGLIQENLKSLIESGGEFPPIHLGYLNNELIVVDGYHRLEATRQLELEKIAAYITAYNSKEQLITDAINENVVHGVRLNEYDIASNLYDLYKNITAKKPLTSLTQFLQYFKMPERTAKRYLMWAILHKGVLEDTVTEVAKVTIAEEILLAFSVKYNFNFLLGAIEEEHKIRIKKFFEKYCDSSREILREAIKAMKDGKEVEKDEIEIALKEKKEKLQHAEEIIKKQEVKEKEEKIKKETNDLDSSSPATEKIEEKAFEETKESNDIIEELMEKKQEVISNIKEQVAPIDNVPDSFKRNLESLEICIMRLRSYQNKRASLIDKEVLNKIINFQDILQEIIEEANQHLYMEQEIKDVV
ncbi:ParB/RepB/Spo0J family partition protein [Fusobacterium necrophorum]|uniref:ParB/RepB/Spo0J family partition protein n=1 Tax=Fusobacterium necrophorum TaxID=859 RepID=UPI00254D8154|nr:ParB/RepB/Spo0J family partition protein [Fusobacterium necrophorum]MDK4524997.1 ParB/RepB/Spo0J family partition protein [Fusobacterium necrophorum]